MVRKLAWAILYLVCFGWWLYGTSLAVMRYSSWPVSSVTQVKYPDSIEYPAITFCIPVNDAFERSYYEAGVENGTMPPMFESYDTAATAFLCQQLRFGRMDPTVTSVGNTTIDLSVEIHSNTTDDELKKLLGSVMYWEMWDQMYSQRNHFHYYEHLIAGGLKSEDLLYAPEG